MECGGTVEDSEGFVNSSFINREKLDRVLKHNLHLECMWMIKVREGFKVSGSKKFSEHIPTLLVSTCVARQIQLRSAILLTHFLCPPIQQILLYFRNFHLEKPNDCESNVVDVFGEKTDISSRWVAVQGLFLHVKILLLYRKNVCTWRVESESLQFSF